LLAHCGENYLSLFGDQLYRLIQMPGLHNAIVALVTLLTELMGGLHFFGSFCLLENGLRQGQ
jgi:hypothetical protein